MIRKCGKSGIVCAVKDSAIRSWFSRFANCYTKRQIRQTMHLLFLLFLLFSPWHTGLTADLSDELETVQKRALRVMFGGSSFTHHSYESFCYNLETLPLSARRDQLAYSFFHKLHTPNFIIFSLLKGTTLKWQT